MDSLSCTLVIITKILVGRRQKPALAFISKKKVRCGWFGFVMDKAMDYARFTWLNKSVYFNYRNRSAALTGFARVNNIGIGVIRAANTAIYVAALNGYRRLCIRTDSMYLLESVLRKMGKWKRCGWIGSDGRPVENMPDFKELSRTIDRYGIQLKWRYTSVNHHCIKCAVKLATQSAKIYKIYSSQHA